MTSALITLGAVLFGWFLGQGTTLVREVRIRRRIGGALLQELFDAESWIRRNILTSELLIQAVEVRAFLGFGPVLVPQTVFDRYYPEIVLRLRRGERISFSAIHARIREMNRMTEQIAERLSTRSGSDEAWTSFAELVAAFRINARITSEMITFHRTHGKRVDPWLQTDQKKKVSEFMTEVVHLREEASRTGYEGVVQKVITHD